MTQYDRGVASNRLHLFHGDFPSFLWFCPIWRCTHTRPPDCSQTLTDPSSHCCQMTAVQNGHTGYGWCPCCNTVLLLILEQVLCLTPLQLCWGQGRVPCLGQYGGINIMKNKTRLDSGGQMVRGIVNEQCVFVILLWDHCWCATWQLFGFKTKFKWKCSNF